MICTTIVRVLTTTLTEMIDNKYKKKKNTNTTIGLGMLRGVALLK